MRAKKKTAPMTNTGAAEKHQTRPPIALDMTIIGRARQKVKPRAFMLRCAECGAEFDEPIVNRRREDMNGEGAWQTWIEWYCPECGGQEIEECIGYADDD